MRSFRHWTPRYVRNRVAEALYHRSHPDEPWLTRVANEILGQYLRATDVGLEFGSGRSTVWFARRVRHVTSVEHDAAWFGRVGDLLSAVGCGNVDRLHVPEGREIESGVPAYPFAGEALETESVDFVLVDGIYRDRCAARAIELLRPGGLLIVDNVNWYLPSRSRSPASRSMRDGPDGEVWAEFARRVAPWRTVWTSSGVTDTALFFKPCRS